MMLLINCVRCMAQQNETTFKKPSKLDKYAVGILVKKPYVKDAVAEMMPNTDPIKFVKNMFFNALILAIILSIALSILFLKIAPSLIIIVPVIGYALFQSMFNKFLLFPVQKSKAFGKQVERDILFAARDMIISMRSGLPLVDAMRTVSNGYGAASIEFSKIINLVALGKSTEDAIEEVSMKSKSKTFKELMLQASVSIKAGADVIEALQAVVEEATNERVIELRRYGQKLNALAMFYMLFGVIFPSMGIAVATIMTTFINIFTVTPTLLAVALVGIAFLQIIFLNIIRGSRPSFTL